MSLRKSGDTSPEGGIEPLGAMGEKPDGRRTPESIEAIRQVLTRHPEIRLALLFGSRARGRGRHDSDLDLALGGRGLDLLGLAAELSLATGLEVDLTDLEQAGYPLLRALLREGRVVYEGESGASASWRVAALSSTELDRPTFERMQTAFLRRLASRGQGSAER